MQEEKDMRPDYKNWIPKGMTYGFFLLGGVLFLAGVLCGTVFHHNVICMILILTAIGVCLWGLWCRYAYGQFSYEGKRKLSKQITEGTAGAPLASALPTASWRIWSSTGSAWMWVAVAAH